MKNKLINDSFIFMNYRPLLRGLDGVQMKIKKKWNCLFENLKTQDIIFVHYEDLNGYLHYEHANDGTRQIYKMTNDELINEGYVKI